MRCATAGRENRSFDNLHVLEYKAKRHTYTLDEEPVPGVTTFIKASLPEGEAIIQWRTQHACQAMAVWSKSLEYPPSSREENKAIRDSLLAYKAALSDAGNIGTALHEYIELYEAAGSDNERQSIVRRFDGEGAAELQRARFSYNTHRASQPPLALIFSEQSVASVTGQYAGTFDRLHKREGKVVLSDFKTSKRAYFSHWVQLGAYSLAIREWLGITVEELEILRFGKDGSFEALTETDSDAILGWEQQAIRCRQTFKQITDWEGRQ